MCVESHPWKLLKASHLFRCKSEEALGLAWPGACQPFSFLCSVDQLELEAGGLDILGSDDEGAVGPDGAKVHGSLKPVPQRGLLRISYGPKAELSPTNNQNDQDTRVENYMSIRLSTNQCSNATSLLDDQSR
ncbi:hypothetical protein R1flu_026901 [Riccia fluitans]|uniref:Uncharacterized protein n=1 Tax=Riccia fluitans TaxID=41844 RepID=A0ABD1XI01_9MARC